MAVDILGHAIACQFAGDVDLVAADIGQQTDSKYALSFDDGNGDYVNLGIQELFAVPSTPPTK